ncbi:signal peptide peptidase domain-containing protein, partial [Reticulomyxa filosa]
DVERLQPKDAYMFPLTSGAVLCILYGLVKYAPKWIINKILRVVFVMIGLFSIQSLLNSIFELFLPHFLSSLLNTACGSICLQSRSYCYNRITIPWPKWSHYVPSAAAKSDSEKIESKDSVTTVITIGTILEFGIAAVASLLWFRNGHYIIHNCIAASVSIQVIAFISPGSFRTATILLVYIFYDIFFVFGTDVMVTVAKNLDVPITFVFLRPTAIEKPYMLGLGDIIFPGICIALLLRFDAFLWISKSSLSTSSSSSSFPSSFYPFFCTYYVVALVAYVLSLGLCLVIMFEWKHAQYHLLPFSERNLTSSGVMKNLISIKNIETINPYTNILAFCYILLKKDSIKKKKKKNKSELITIKITFSQINKKAYVNVLFSFFGIKK